MSICWTPKPLEIAHMETLMQCDVAGRLASPQPRQAPRYFDAPLMSASWFSLVEFIVNTEMGRVHVCDSLAAPAKECTTAGTYISGSLCRTCVGGSVRRRRAMSCSPCPLNHESTKGDDCQTTTTTNLTTTTTSTTTTLQAQQWTPVADNKAPLGPNGGFVKRGFVSENTMNSAGGCTNFCFQDPRAFAALQLNIQHPTGGMCYCYTSDTTLAMYEGAHAGELTIASWTYDTTSEGGSRAWVKAIMMKVGDGACSCSSGIYNRHYITPGKGLAAVKADCLQSATCSGFTWAPHGYDIIPFVGGHIYHSGSCGFGPPLQSTGQQAGWSCWAKGDTTTTNKVSARLTFGDYGAYCVTQSGGGTEPSYFQLGTGDTLRLCESKVKAGGYNYMQFWNDNGRCRGLHQCPFPYDCRSRSCSQHDQYVRTYTLIQAPTTEVPVTWTTLHNAVSGGNGGISQTGGGWRSCYASTDLNVTSVTWKFGQGGEAFFGFCCGATCSDSAERGAGRCHFAVYMAWGGQANRWYIQDGTNTGQAPWDPDTTPDWVNDEWSLRQRADGKIEYLRNDVVFYTSVGTPTSPLRIRFDGGATHIDGTSSIVYVKAAIATSQATTTTTTQTITTTTTTTLQEVCVGTRNDEFGQFQVDRDIIVSKMKLIYHRGYVSCNGVGNSPFGCGGNHIAMAITNQQNQRLIPSSDCGTNVVGFSGSCSEFSRTGWYYLSGTNAASTELIWNLTRPLTLNAGQYRVWYGEDLLGVTESDNRGQACYGVAWEAGTTTTTTSATTTTTTQAVTTFHDPRIPADTGDGNGIGNGDHPGSAQPMCQMAGGAHFGTTASFQDDQVAARRFCIWKGCKDVHSLAATTCASGPCALYKPGYGRRWDLDHSCPWKRLSTITCTACKTTTTATTTTTTTATTTLQAYVGCYSTLQRVALGWTTKGSVSTAQSAADMKNVCDGFNYMSLECPRQSAVHVYCYNQLVPNLLLDNKECQGDLSTNIGGGGSNQHCTGPYYLIAGMPAGGWHRGATYNVAALQAASGGRRLAQTPDAREQVSDEVAGGGGKTESSLSPWHVTTLVAVTLIATMFLFLRVGFPFLNAGRRSRHDRLKQVTVLETHHDCLSFASEDVYTEEFDQVVKIPWDENSENLRPETLTEN